MPEAAVAPAGEGVLSEADWLDTGLFVPGFTLLELLLESWGCAWGGMSFVLIEGLMASSVKIQDGLG